MSLLNYFDTECAISVDVMNGKDIMILDIFIKIIIEM